MALIHHIELYVSNLEISKEFWGCLLEGLGCHLFQEWTHGVSWKQADTYVVLVQTEDKYLEIPYHRKRTGLNHVAFCVSTQTKLDKIVSQLETRGIKLLYGGTQGIFFEDPDRIKIELVVRS